MNLSAPTTIVFLVAVVLAVLALIMFLGVLPIAGIPAFWVMTVAFIVLAVGCLFNGL